MIELVGVRLDHPRGGTALVTDANLKVTSGEVVLIIGAAGVGTSRIVAAALGELALGDGRIEVLGRDIGKLRRSSLRLLRRRIGIVPQDLCLLEERSAQLNVVMPLEIDGVPRSVSLVRAAAVLAQLGLEDEASLPVECLSASARQRVAVARALVRDPELIVADHPTSMQDAGGAERICEAFYEAAARGASVLLLGRDPALRVIAERNQWRQFAMLGGALAPLDDVEVGTIDDILGGIESEPTPLRAVPDDDLPNVLPFPRSDARPATGPVAARPTGTR